MTFTTHDRGSEVIIGVASYSLGGNVPNLSQTLWPGRTTSLRFARSKVAGRWVVLPRSDAVILFFLTCFVVSGAIVLALPRGASSGKASVA